MKIFALNLSHIPQILSIESVTHLTPWSEKIIQGSFGPRSRNFGLFKKNKGVDELIGYYFAEYVAGEMTLENICVDANCQGKGYAKVLMSHLIEQAKEEGAEELWLEVRVSNLPAIALYLSCGFENISVRKDYYKIPNSTEKEDAQMMKLSLAAP